MFGLASTQIVTYAPENSPRYMSDRATPNRNRVDYGVSDAIYVDIYAKRSILNKLLTYLNTKDTIAQMKEASPGIDQYDTMNYTLASIGLGLSLGNEKLNLSNFSNVGRWARIFDHVQFARA